MINVCALLIEEVAVFGTFEILYLAISRVGSYIPTLFAYLQSLPENYGQILILAVVCSIIPIYTFFKKYFDRFIKYLHDKL